MQRQCVIHAPRKSVWQIPAAFTSTRNQPKWRHIGASSLSSTQDRTTITNNNHQLCGSVCRRPGRLSCMETGICTCDFYGLCELLEKSSHTAKGANGVTLSLSLAIACSYRCVRSVVYPHSPMISQPLLHLVSWVDKVINIHMGWTKITAFREWECETNSTCNYVAKLWCM